MYTKMRDLEGFKIEIITSWRSHWVIEVTVPYVEPDGIKGDGSAGEQNKLSGEQDPV